MQLSNSPKKISLPFSASGSRANIPVASQIGIKDGAASYSDGFPPLTRTFITAGGKPPDGLEMNGILYEMSAILRWYSVSGGYQYDASFATSADVGGYPKGARLLRADGEGYWINTADNNQTDPESSGASAAGWVPDFSGGSVTIPVTSSNVTLTPAQYAKNIIIITGTITGNLNIIFPPISKEWIILNRTVGNFSITCKTASGLGVAVDESMHIVCDSINIFSSERKQSGITKEVSFYDFGAIGDGTLHTVAEWIIPGALGRYASLAACQVDYPHVQSTSDSIDWAAGQAALNTPHSINVGEGIFVLNDELLNTVKGRIFKGSGGGYIAVDNKSIYGALTKFLVLRSTTMPSYRKTRRQAPETAAGPHDAPMSCVISNQAENSSFSDFAIELDCDYTDASPSNLGGVCDVGFFSGCRIRTRIYDVPVLGYFRVASIYLDVSDSPAMAAYTTNRGVIIPRPVASGSDQCVLSGCRTKGGLKGLFLAGAKNSASGAYYDIISGTTYPTIQGGRGSSGSSDLLIDANCYFESREHHSGYRAYDPTMNPATENTDLLAACIAIDARRSNSSGQGRVRRINLQNVRMKTIEACRLWLDRSYEVNLNWVHTEPNSAVTVKNTSGAVIDIVDYDLHSYGPIACRPTSGIDDGTDEVTCFGLWGTGLVEKWSKDNVISLTNIRHHIDSGKWVPSFFFDTSTVYVSQTGTWTKAGDIVFCEFRIQYSSTSITDTSPITIAGIPKIIHSESTACGYLNLLKSTGFVSTAGKSAIFGDSGSNTRLAITSGDNVSYKYNGGNLLSSGVIQGAFWFRESVSFF